VKVVAFIIGFVIFLASLYCFTLAFQVPGWEIAIFLLGIIGVSIAFAIPFHILRRLQP